MTPIVVFVHIHYVETWAGLRSRIEHGIGVPFRLIVTTTGDVADIEPPVNTALRGFEIIRTQNRGRDVLPFLSALEAAGEFEIGLKLHGKRSVHRIDGEAWRDALVSSLLSSRETVSALVGRMRADPRLTFVGPERSLASIDRHMGDNASSLRAVTRRLGLDLAEIIERTPFFSAGTMFWFRRDSLAKLLRADLTDLFAQEDSQIDGTAAHALERLFPAIAEIGGRVAAPVDIVLATDVWTPTAELRRSVRKSVDTDETFARVPGPLAAFVLRRARFMVPVYFALPKRLRRALKSVL